MSKGAGKACGRTGCEKNALLFAQSSIEVPNAPCVVTSPESKRAFFSAIQHFYGNEIASRPSCGVGTHISPKVKLGHNVTIGCNCVLDGDITIGDHTTIWHNVTILNHVTIGAGCEIQSHVEIGHDGFGYVEEEGKKQ